MTGRSTMSCVGVSLPCNSSRRPKLVEISGRRASGSPSRRDTRTASAPTAMGSLLDLSRPDAALPRPADPRLCELGFAAWETALAESADHSGSAIARAWAATEAGKRLLAALFGNSPFLGKLAVAEWPLLLRYVEDGPDALFDEIASG